MSIIGTARIKIGNTDGPLPGISVVQIEITAITYPKNILPESPMKIEACGLLNAKNPVVTPIKINIIKSRENCSCHQQNAPKYNSATIDNPLAKPSNPSIKLIELETPRIKKTQ